VRALASDPRHPETVYLGGSNGVLYRSDDSGSTWHALGFPLRGMSLDEIVVDPRGRIVVGYWEVAGKGGGISWSEDGGKTFTAGSGIEGESVRAVSLFAGNPDTLVAGTLTGVFRSSDGARNWERIATIPNVESVATDPDRSSSVYVGTWHLPWKTVDGGQKWRTIKSGIVEDSDIFTLTVDHRDHATLFATACTGIYRSRNFGEQWSRIQGIPQSSRRTRCFSEDPERPGTLYAGTTEGLWVSEDDGASWRLATSRALVVNAILVLPGSRILLGCDGAGVLRSFDQGRTWASSNDGFSERFVSAIAFDPALLTTYVGVQGDRQHGGVFARTAGEWRRLGTGLEGREVLSLALWEGAVWAGTDDGVYLFRRATGAWQRAPAIFEGRELHGRVPSLATLSRGLFAATADGLLFRATGEGAWERRTPGLPSSVLAVVASPRGSVLAASALAIFRSQDQGASWERIASSPDPRLHTLAFLPGSEDVVFAPTPSGLYRSSDQGRTWFRRGGGLPISDITGLALHPDGKTLYASDFTWGGLFRSLDSGATWSPLPTDGLPSDRIWAIALDETSPDQPLVASRTGGLSVLSAQPRGSAAGSQR
jgi:photosystem II stability/assembly factor-like uncharacterized protein